MKDIPDAPVSPGDANNIAWHIRELCDGDAAVIVLHEVCTTTSEDLPGRDDWRGFRSDREVADIVHRPGWYTCEPVLREKDRRGVLSLALILFIYLFV